MLQIFSLCVWVGYKKESTRPYIFLYQYDRCVSVVNIIFFKENMNMANWKTTLCASGSILCGLAWKLLKDNAYRSFDKCDINEVLLYGAEDKGRMREIGLENLHCIYYVIAHATRTIDVCVPSLGSETIAKCLINVQQKNKAQIRVTIHNSDDYHNLKSFAESGIQVKVVKSVERLEHEFILIDADKASDAVAVIGSLDYEAGRVNCNRDSTLLTSEVAVIKTLRQEFNRVWNSARDYLQ